MSTDARSDDVLELLGNERVREILAATSDAQLSASELSERSDVAVSTIYRRVEDMLAHDLLVEGTRIEADGSHHSVYRANVDRVDVAVADGHIDVKLHVREDAARRFSRLWSDIRET